MKLQIEIRRTMILLLFFSTMISCFGQSVTQSNPLEYAAIGEGESRINEIIGKQNEILDTLSVLHGGMVVAETKMKKWEQKYNSYLKTTQGYADAIKAGCTLYMQGMQTLSALWEINTACKINPQGIAASVSMNTLYAETAVALVKTYRILKTVVAKGGEGNMLKGSERTKILWQLNTELEQLNRKFRSLALSISLYTFEDVWNKAIAGKIEKSNKILAKEAQNRQKRAMKVVARFYRERQSHKTWGVVMMKHFKIIRYIFLLMALFLAPVSSSAIGVAEDLVRAGMFKTFATSATKALKASDAVLTVNAGEHMMSKEEIDKVVKFQTQFNNYLTNFDNILTYAAEIYAIYYEVDQTGRNLSELKSVALSSPTNIIAVALLRSRNYIYKDVVENGVQIALDIEKLLPLKKDKEKNAKMSEKERLECIGNVRKSLREMNRKIRKMNLLLRYTTLMDCWYDLKGQYYRPKSMHAICKSCQRRWANNASKWKRK